MVEHCHVCGSRVPMGTIKTDLNTIIGAGMEQRQYAELQAAREVVEIARKVAFRGPVYVSELRAALERYDEVQGGAAE